MLEQHDGGATLTDTIDIKSILAEFSIANEERRKVFGSFELENIRLLCACNYYICIVIQYSSVSSNYYLCIISFVPS